MLLAVVLVLSVIVASFFGHVIHWSLHKRWTGPAHRGHMEHHFVHYPKGKLTSDKYKSAKWYHSGPLLFTPPLLVILAVFGGLFWRLGAPHWVIWVFGAVLIVYGLINDAFHDSFHIQKQRLQAFRWYRDLRMMHFLHHYDTTINFGVISFVWDRVFGTKRTTK